MRHSHHLSLSLFRYSKKQPEHQPITHSSFLIFIREFIFGQDQKKLFVSNAHCFADNSETKAAIEKVNAPFCSTN
jgi:hypothetical protein